MDLYLFGFIILVAGATSILRQIQNGGDGNDKIDKVPENIAKYHFTRYCIKFLITLCQVSPEIVDKLLNDLRFHPSFQPTCYRKVPSSIVKPWE